MTHHSENDPTHGHEHHLGHAHSDAPLSFSDKLFKLLDHWIQHNHHHADDYRKWAREAREHGQAAVADLLDSAAELTDTISARFHEARERVQ